MHRDDNYLADLVTRLACDEVWVGAMLGQWSLCWSDIEELPIEAFLTFIAPVPKLVTDLALRQVVSSCTMSVKTLFSSIPLALLRVLSLIGFILMS